MTTTTEDPPPKISNMTYSELVGFYQLQIGRVEMAWHRVMYLHAAIVGVLVFFGQSDDTYLIQRFLVFGFYTVNMLIFYFSLHEGYQALREIHRDLMRFPEGDGNVEAWFRKRRMGYKSAVRIAIMTVTWLLIGSLLFRAWLSG